MPKQPWPPSNNSATRKSWNRLEHGHHFFCLLLLVGLLILSVNHSSAAAPTRPRQQLDIAFALQDHRLTGRSLITIPARLEVTVILAGLEITGLHLNNTVLQAREQIIIPISPQEQQLTVNFHKTYAGGQADGLIAANGIALTGLWHPLLDTACHYALTAAIPKQFTAVSEAEEISDTVTGDIRTVRFRFDHPLAGLNFVAGPYVVEQDPFGPGQTLYSYFFAEDQELAAEYRKKALGYLKRYQELIGPYPYQRFSIVENRLPTGYAMPTFTLLGQAVVRLPFITETSLGHEVLHSWFGNAIDVDPAQGNWCEGLTTYLADQAFAAEAGTGATFRKQQLITYQSYVGADNTMAIKDFSGAGSHLASGDKAARAARAVGYEKTSMVFHLLRREIGDPAFYAGLRDFYARFRHQQAGWPDLAASFSKSAGQDLAPFFNQWLNRPDLPRLQITSGPLTEKEDKLELVLTLKQLQENPYRLKLPLDIITATDKERLEVTLTEAETKLTVSLADYPLLVIVDQDYDLPRTLAPEELPPTWSRFLGARDKLAIIPEGETRQIYAPLLELLAALNCPTKGENEATDKDLAGKSVIFLGNDSRLARSIFAGQPQAAPGFTLEAKENPLAPGQVAVLTASASAAETAAAAPKLAHYGRYSALHFNLGRVDRKIIAETDQGLRLAIDTPPMGIALPRASSFAAIMEQLADKQVVYVGEAHTRYEDHLLQLRVIRALFAQNPKLAIGMEMFSREAQPVLDRYVAGELSEREFLKQSGYFSNWGYDYRLYREIITFARRHRLPIVALNQEKAIVGKVFKEGTSALTAEEIAKIPTDRDLAIPGYRQRISEVFTMHGRQGSPPKGQINGFFQAQALWDETMAESVADFLNAHPESRMVVLAGHGHTDKATAIPPRVARRLPAIRQAVILNSRGEELEQTEADYLIFSKPVELPPSAVLGVILTNTAEGPRVEGLSEQSKAGAAGILEKDIIIALDEESVATIDDLKIILLAKETGKPVMVRIKRESGFWFKQEEILSLPVGL